MWWKLTTLTACLCLVQRGSVAQLLGDHVCQEEERYQANVTESFFEPILVRSYRWCMAYPPRCSFYQNKTIVKLKTIERTFSRIVEKCCIGFLELNNECVSECPICRHGRCEDRQCKCYPGYQGEFCQNECDSNYWGRNCSEKCTCKNAGLCDHITGSCVCQAGWTGLNCEKTCPEGYFGLNCNKECSCTKCDKVDGRCIEENTTPWMPPSTTQRISSTTHQRISSTTQTITSTMSLTTEPQTTPFKITHFNNGQFRTNSRKIIEFSTLDTFSTPTSKKTTYQFYLSSDEVDTKEPPAQSKEETSIFEGLTMKLAYSGFALVIVIVLIPIISLKIKSLRKRDDKVHVEMVKTKPVQVYTKSIFHTPLPDPPTAEGFPYPITFTGGCCEKSGLPSSIIDAPTTPPPPPSLINPSSTKTFQVYQTISNDTQFFYDQPRSKSTFFASATTLEPVYDEIPQNVDTVSNPLYR